MKMIVSLSSIELEINSIWISRGDLYFYELPLFTQAVKQWYFKYLFETARYWGDLGFFFLHLLSGNPNYIIYTRVFI